VSGGSLQNHFGFDALEQTWHHDYASDQRAQAVDNQAHHLKEGKLYFRWVGKGEKVEATKNEEMRKTNVDLVVFLRRPDFLGLDKANEDGQRSHSVEDHVLWEESALDAGERVTRQNEQQNQA